MVELLMTLIVFLLIIGLIYWAVHRIAAAFGIPAPIVVVIDVILVVLAVIYLVSVLVPLLRRGLA